MLAQLAVGLITAIVASWFTVRWSLQRFYREKWWERRFEAYSNIIVVMHNLNLMLKEEQVKVLQPQTAKLYGPLTHDRLYAQVNQIGRAIDVGELLVSKEMVSLLREFARQLKATEQLGAGALDASVDLIGETLPKAAALARKDLRLTDQEPWHPLA